jgi:hypothetical protein
LQKLSAQELKERNVACVPKGSMQVQRKDGIQAKGAMEVIKKRKTKRQFPTPRFAPNHQNYQSSYHPYTLQMPPMLQSWGSSLDMFGHPPYPYFYSWMPYGSLYHRGWSPNCDES